MNQGWTLPDDIAATVRRRWDDGTLLRAHADGAPFEVIDVPVRGPTSSAIGDDLAAVRDWIGQLVDGARNDRRYSLVWREVGGRSIGRNRLPSRAVVSTFEQAWALLGVGAEVGRFDQILSTVAGRPAVRAWVLQRPHRALGLDDVMPALLAAYDWLTTHRGSGRYLREISAPGVDTKFAETHRSVLAQMLGVPPGAAGFVAGLGLRDKPGYVRLRPSPSLGLGLPVSELAVRESELAELDLAPQTALVVENEITYLSVEVPTSGVVLWGKGFAVDRIGRLPWLERADVTYWGDIDTHGFAILDRLRARLPQVRSVLMDHATLLAHRDSWVEEPKPARATLTRLTPTERALYEDLVTDALGRQVRLEQERVDWNWAAARLAG